MASMVEKVARAIYEADRHSWWDDLVPDPIVGRTKAHCDARKEREYRRARAALEALKEPTPEMEIVGARSLRDDMGDANFSARARRCHRAMITTALEDT